MAAPLKIGETAGIAGSTDATAHPGEDWVDGALAHSVDFLHMSAPLLPRFQIRHVRAWAESRGLKSPPDCRAWGHIARKLKKANLIAPAGFGFSVDPVQHAGIVNEWRAV